MTNMTTPPKKIVLLGDTSVGKTSIVTRWSTGAYKPDQKPTVGSAYTEISREDAGRTHRIQIWDTAGAEKFRSMAPIYAQGASGALIVFDVTSPETLQNVPQWVQSLGPVGGVPIVLVGNKCDLEAERRTTPEEGVACAERIDAAYFEVSALTGLGVDESIDELIMRSIRSSHVVPEAVPIDTPEKKESSCC